MAAPVIESINLAVTYTVAGDDQVPTYRDTIHLDVPVASTSITSTQLRTLRQSAIAEATARWQAWRNDLLNPPVVEAAPVDVFALAEEALNVAQQTTMAAQAAIEAARNQTKE